MGNQSSHPASPRQSTHGHGSSSPARGPGTPTSASSTAGASSGSASQGRHRALSLSTLLPSASAPISTASGGRARSGTAAAEDTPSTPPLLISGGHLSPQGPGANAIISSKGQEGLVAAPTPLPGTTTSSGATPTATPSGGGGGYNVAIVKSLILEKRLAPFYRGLDDYEPEWTDEDVVRALKDSRAGNPVGVVDPDAPAGAGGTGSVSATSRIRHAVKASTEVQVPQSEREAREARAYRDAQECPICFLYYPANINTSRCCQQPICTDCFVQMKRADATLQHLESEPACCPFCVEADFGVIYEVGKIVPQDSTNVVSSVSSEISIPDPGSQRDTLRRKSVSHKSKEVVTVDQIRPDWEERLNAVKAQAARRASRRIIMQRVGDRLIPVGYTSSRNAAAQNGELGPILTTAEEEALASAVSGSRSGRRSGRRGGSTGEAGLGGQELEELMIMEAMRLSMIDHEEHQRKEAETKKKQETEAVKHAASGGEGSSSGARGLFAKVKQVGSGSSSRRQSVDHSQEGSQGNTSRRGSVVTSPLVPQFPAASTSAVEESPPVPDASAERPNLISLESTDTIPASHLTRMQAGQSRAAADVTATPTPAGYARLEDD